MDADHDARYHAGYHSGLKEEDAEVIVLERNGRELFRFHAFFQEEHYERLSTCDNCDEQLPEGRVSCPECGYIPTEERLA
jgi:hypothetical protein